MKSHKERFNSELQKIVQYHHRGAGGLRVAIALTKRLDFLIQSIYPSRHHSNKSLIAVVALGGYGRKELCFSSDTDVMFLIKDDSQKAEAAPVVGDLLHSLLEFGLNIGHSFRTIQECVELAEADLE